MRRLISCHRTRWGLIALLAILSASTLWATTAGRLHCPIASGEPLAGQVFAPEVLLRTELLVPQASDATGIDIRTEALTRIGASDYHDHGYTGQDVKVAVIDAYFDGYTDRIRDGELPATLVTRPWEVN